MQIAKKVKSIQMFKQPAPQCCKVTQNGLWDASLGWWPSTDLTLSTL